MDATSIPSSYEQTKQTVANAHLLSNEGRYEESIPMLRVAKDAFETMGCYIDVLHCHIMLAKDFFHIGDVKSAFQLVNEYEPLCARHQVAPDYTKLYPMLGLLYANRQQYEKAKSYFRESYLLGFKEQDYATAAHSLNLYASLTFNEQQFDETLAAVDLAIECIHRVSLSLPVELCCAKNLKIRALLAQHRLADAKHVFDSINGRDFYHSAAKELANTYNLYALYYTHLEEFEQAFRMQKQAVRLFREHEIKDYQLLATMLEQQLSIAKKLGNIDKILVTYEEYVAALKALLEYNANEEFALASANQQMAEIKEQAERDSLTGIYNRRYLEDTASQWIEQAHATSDNVTIVLFDIDKFKRINDTYGHLAGDHVIQYLATKCQKSVEDETTIVARYGGDEFVVVFKELTPLEGLERAENLFTLLSSLVVDFEKIHIPISISMGVAHTQVHDVYTFKKALQAADEALYASKQNGRGRLTVAQKKEGAVR